MSAKEQILSKVLWSAVERFSVQGIQFILTLVIARILLPSDYGLVAMLTIFMVLSQVIVDSGFASALIQKKDRTDIDYSTAFYFNAIGSLIIYACLFLSAPFIASFFNEPQLNSITKVFGLNVIIMSMGIVQQAKLMIELDFKRQAIASLIAVISSGTLGLWLAFHNYGVWTLVYQSLANNFVRVLMQWIFSRWLPSFCFSFQSFRSLFGFGSKLMLSVLLHQFYTNLYSLVIGKFFLASDLGYFNRAYTIAQFPSSNLSNILMKVMYPIQCRYQDDMEQLRSIFMKYMRISIYAVFPLMIMLVALAEPLVHLILTDKWLPAVPYLRILCIAFMWDPIMRINSTILNVKGRTDYFLKAEVIKKAVAIILLVISVPFGVTAMCYSLLLYSMADIVIIIYFSRRVTQIGYGKQLTELSPIVGLNALMGICLYLVTLLPLSAWGKLLLGVPSGIIIYLSVSCVFHMSEWQMLLSVLKKSRGRSSQPSE